MRRFYSTRENIAESTVVLDLEQSRHLRSVLRLKNGDEVSAFDGLGNELLCAVHDIGHAKSSAKLRIIRKLKPPAPESDLELILAVALLKSDKFDLVIQKSVELGVSKLVPLVTKRCDVKPKNVESKLGRFERIIIEASKQCGRSKLMELSRPIEFEEFSPAIGGSRILFAERSGDKFSDILPSKKITALIGPEGGWEDSEIEFAIGNGFQIITLAGRILRAETAAVAITSLLQHNFGDLN